MDYSSTSIREAVANEVSKALVTAIKQMDADLAEKRLAKILRAGDLDEEFISVAAQFNSLVGHKTSADY